ncbi:hypothetical protein FACS1894186_1060 [Alphaproteobacteria bacterium]|nr:hypothetical protein FACS1894186_1060 [Alphaproteobacteria bacterium]
MADNASQRKTLAVLTRLAKFGTDERQRELAAAREIRQREAAKLAALDQDKATQAAFAKANPAEAFGFGLWLRGWRERRKAQAAVLSAAASAEEAAEDRLREAFREQKTYEISADEAKRASAYEAAARDQKESDDRSQTRRPR